MPTNTKPKPTLFDLAAELQELIDHIEDNIDADLPDNQEVLAGMLQEASGRLETKLDGYADYLASCSQHVVTIREEITRLTKLQKYWEAKQARLKALLLYFFQTRGIVRLETEFHRFNLQDNGGVLPMTINANAKPEEIAQEYPEFVRIIPAQLVFDNDQIRQHLEAGKPLEFAQLGTRSQRVAVK